MASAVQEKYGGNLQSLIAQGYRSFQLVFRFGQEYPDRAKKRLLEISAYCYDVENDQVSVHQLCRFHPETGSWLWKADFKWAEDLSGPEKTGKEWKRMEELLKELEFRNPLKGNTVMYPRYYRPVLREGEPE